jgi:predicted MFS family arabinose efflux permease
VEVPFANRKAPIFVCGIVGAILGIAVAASWEYDRPIRDENSNARDDRLVTFPMLAGVGMTAGIFIGSKIAPRWGLVWPHE